MSDNVTDTGGRRDGAAAGNGRPSPNGAGRAPSAAPSTAGQSGEVIGLMSAINYCAAVAAAHENHSQAGGEAFLGALESMEFGPETRAAVAAAQEATTSASGAWRAAEAKLKEQLAAKEHTTEETPNKQALLAE